MSCRFIELHLAGEDSPPVFVNVDQIISISPHRDRSPGTMIAFGHPKNYDQVSETYDEIKQLIERL